MIRSYKIRLLPTKDQETALWDSVNAVRYVWNWGLAFQMERFQDGEKHLSGYALGRELTKLKQQEEYKWLNQVSNKAMKQAVLDLSKAYERFFAVQKQGEKFSKQTMEKAKRQNRTLTSYDLLGHPKFKKKGKAKPSFYVNYEQFYFLNENVVIEKIGKVKYQTKYDLPVVKKKSKNQVKFSNPRVSYENGKWLLTFGMECENQAQVQEPNDLVIGIDLGVKELAVLSNGKVFKNVNKTKRVKRIQKRFEQKQRKVSRKYHTNGTYDKSNNILKAEREATNLYRRLRNLRIDYTHKVTREIVNLLPKAIVLEDLNVKGMMKNKHLSRAIASQNFSEFVRQIVYKSEWQGTKVVFADRFYPSSKKCSNCGAIRQELKLKDRVYECKCGFVMNRDLNAAKNLQMLAI